MNLVKNGFLALLILGITLFSCQKVDLKLGEGERVLSASSMSVASVGVLGGGSSYSSLGFGYDVVNGRRPHNSSVKLQVIDVAKLIQNESANVLIDSGVSESFDLVMASDAQDFSSKLTQKYKLSAGWKVFKGEVKFASEDSTKFSSRKTYSSATKVVRQKSFNIFTTTADIRSKYLAANFVNDLNNLSPQALVYKYGTHVLTKIVLGAKFDVYYSSETSQSDRIGVVNAGLNANALFKIFNLDANVSYNSSLTQYNFNQRVKYASSGGDGTRPLIGEISLNNGSTPKIDIAAWQSTNNKQNAVLVDVMNDGFIPLYDLIENATKRTQVKNYIDAYASNDPLFMNNPTSPVFSYYSSKGDDHFSNLDGTIAQRDNYWRLLGSEFHAFNYRAPGTVPVFQYNNPTGKDHYLSTATVYELNASSIWWTELGVAFFAYKEAAPGRTPVYSYINKKRTNHYVSPGPNVAVRDSNWIREGIAFYVPSPNPGN